MATRREWLKEMAAVTVALWTVRGWAAAQEGNGKQKMSTEEEILAMERAAMERWAKGDPDGFLEISAAEVSYFDPFVDSRVDGLTGLRALYETLRGKVHLEQFEFVEPRVQVLGDAAVLSYRFRSQGSDKGIVWNTTEVYRRSKGKWQIVHTHWAFHKPRLA